MHHQTLILLTQICLACIWSMKSGSGATDHSYNTLGRMKICWSTSIKGLFCCFLLFDWFWTKQEAGNMFLRSDMIVQLSRQTNLFWGIVPFSFTIHTKGYITYEELCCWSSVTNHNLLLRLRAFFLF